MVPTRRFTCITPAPRAPGAMSASRRLICGVMRGRVGRSDMPTLRIATARRRHWPTPAAATPHDMAWPGLPVMSVRKSSAPIMQMLRTIGAAAAAPKR